MIVYYFPIEPVKSRYTYDLCFRWMPDTFEAENIDYTMITGEQVDQEIQFGCVLDATARGIYSLSQVSQFLKLMRAGKIKDGDVLFFQDFYTPGMEAIFYAAKLMGLSLRTYSMLHAQSVDIYDFTYPMRSWMRLLELGYADQHTGIFVSSSFLKELLVVAGYKCPIHVTCLPYDSNDVWRRTQPQKEKEDVIYYASRLDQEKQPEFMLEVAAKFLELHPTWWWIISTSGANFRSNVPGMIDALEKFAKSHSRFIMLSGIPKDDYYKNLACSKINFSSALQDFVSYVLLESITAGCDLVYPAFRSFLEVLPVDRLYKAFQVTDALRLIDEVIKEPKTHYDLARLADYGRRMQAKITAEGYAGEYNIYKELSL